MRLATVELVWGAPPNRPPKLHKSATKTEAERKTETNKPRLSRSKVMEITLSDSLTVPGAYRALGSIFLLPEYFLLREYFFTRRSNARTQEREGRTG